MKDLERKTHYKMYKSHKGWLVAGITVTSLAVGIFAGPQATQTAKADDGTPATEATSDANAAENASQVTLSKSDTTESGTQSDPAPAAKSTPVAETTGVADDATQEEPVTENGTANSGSNAVNDPAGKDSGDGTITEEKQDALATANPVSAENAEVSDTTAEEDANQSIEPVKTGITVQNPDDLTNKVTGQPSFNVSKDNQLQYTYDHTDANGVSSDLRVVDGYSASHQTQGTGAWLGETYANNIPQDAKGYDTNSPFVNSQLYIDEWLPDSGLQYFIWQNNFASKYATMADFRNNFTKAELATVTNITTTEAMQATTPNGSVPTSYYYALMSMKTLEGLQNATNLETLYLYPNPIVSQATYGTGMKNGNLWDIRALSGLKNLQSVDITLFSVNDISALGNKDNLTHVGLAYNQVTDISPLATDKNLDIKTGTALSNQHILLAPIHVSDKLASGNSTTADGTLTYTTPSFIIKDLTSANLPIKGFDNSEQTLYPLLYPSSADAGNVNDNTLSWYNLLAGTQNNYGSLSTTWADTNSDFAGYIIQPYDLAENVSDLNVNVQLLQAYGQQLELGPSTLISGQVGDQVNVQENATVMTLLNQQLSKGYTFSGLILDGTGRYSDYLAGNGLANAQSSWVTTLDKESKNWTILFYKDVLPWNVTVDYGYKDADGKFTAITDADDTAVTDSHTGTSDEQLALKDYQKDFSDYVYTGAESSVDGTTWTDISQDATIPFLGAKQVIHMAYTQAKRATVTIKDATTGETVQTLDYTTNPELRDAIGTTSSFDSATVTDPAVAKGYVVVSDTTKNADGTSAIVFTNDDTANLNFVVTLAHAFNTVEKAVQEQITYQDTQKNQVADPTTKTITFATVTDQVTNQSVTYSKADATSAPTLDVTGKPTDAGWTVYQAGDQVAFDAVQNPMIKGMHVVKTTDPANDLTQVTEQTITSEAANLAFVVTYAADTTGGGGNPDPENPDPENPDPETPDPGNPGGGGSVTPEVPSTGSNSSGSAGDQGTANKKPNKVTGGQNAGAVNNGGSAATGQPGMTAAVTTGGHAAKVDLAANTAKQPAQATSKDVSDQLPQTNEQANNGLAVVGLALLGALAGVFGWKKRRN
ncbi:LPXTG cell wall anchor domain-containing protein [Levilactobacillus spicheri]